MKIVQKHKQQSKCYVIYYIICRFWPTQPVQNWLWEMVKGWGEELQPQTCLYSTVQDQGSILASFSRSSGFTNVSGNSTAISDLLMQGEAGDEETWGDLISVHKYLLRGE